VEEIAKLKLPDLNASDLTAAIATIKGTARSIGIDVTA
jgi:large subunit ribosomal protein L11